MASDVDSAAELYREFREDEPKRARKIKVRLPKAVAVMGYCEFICYVTTHNGKVVPYKHEFAPGSRPLLCAGPGKSQLYLIGGRFRVTGRGITDLDRSGRTVHARERYKVTTKD